MYHALSYQYAEQFKGKLRKRLEEEFPDENLKQLCPEMTLECQKSHNIENYSHGAVPDICDFSPE